MRFFRHKNTRERHAHTFDISIPSTVITYSESSTFLRLGAQRRLKQIIYTLIVDFKECHP